MIETGPPTPRYAPGFIPGTNSIGQFSIGVSPIGDLATFDPWATLLMQYANSPEITSMITAFNAAMDQTQNIANLYDAIWNVLTAQGIGLDIWGRIVGVARTLTLPGATANFGFQEAGSSWTGFNQGTFFTGGSLTSNFSLNDANFRTLVLAKAAGNISDGSIVSVNSILLRLFPNRGRAYVADGLNMSLTYTFEFPLTIVEQAIIEQSGVLPSAAGVIVNVSQH
jgi:hypothetical protein